MNRVKQLTALLLVLLLTAALFSVPALAEETEKTVACEIPELKLELQIPADAIVLTPDTSLVSEDWEKAGIDNPSKSVEEYKAVGVVAEIVTADHENHVRLIKGDTEKTQSVFTFNDYSQEDLNAYFAQLAETDSEYVTMTCESYAHAQTTFFVLDTHAVPGMNETDFREILWGTIINGYTAGFSIYAEDGKITDEQIEFAENLVDTGRFTEILERPVTTYSTTEIIITLAFTLGLFALIVGFIIWTIVRRKRMKSEAKAYAEQITNFRMAQKTDPGQHEVAALFVNRTEHSDAAIQTFAKYQAYFHHPFNIFYYILVSLAGLLVCLVSNDAWWIMLLMVGVFGYCVYYIVTLPNKLARRIRESFRKLPNRTAVFTFFDNDFRLAGIQSPSLYPYAQITEAREFGDYFYLYFGEETTYYLRKDQFTLGNADEFARFLSGKLGKKFKGYKERRHK